MYIWLVQYFTLPHTIRADLSSPSRSQRNGRNPSGIRVNSDLSLSKKKKKHDVRFLAIPSHSESFRAESEQIPTDKKTWKFLSIPSPFLVHSESIPSLFLVHS